MVDKEIIKEIRSAIKANDLNNKRPKRFEVKSIIVDKKGIQEIKKYKFYN